MSDLRIERNFPVAPSALFAFISQSENLLKWWGPEGMSIPEHKLDFTKLGPWSSVMMNAEGGKYKVTGEVINVDPPNSVEFTWAWHDEDDVRGNDTTVRFEVTSNGAGGSNFTLIHTGLKDEESVSNHNMGWSSSFNKLQRLAD